MRAVSHFQFQGSVVLITGASSGLGAEFARQLAPHAATLILVARRGERLEALSQELQRAYPHVSIHRRVHDLLLASEREKLAAWIREEKIPLDFLINNAGLGDLGNFFEASWSRLEEIITLNITAFTHLTHLFLPILRKQAPSALLQVGSIAGFFPLPGNSVYAASKAYVEHFSKALYVEEKKQGVLVTLLCPGPTPTEFLEVAGRSGKKIPIESRAPACFITPAKKVVTGALQGIIKERASVIPNFLLQGTITLLRFIPFSFLCKFRD